jgi:hypothetical protein
MVVRFLAFFTAQRHNRRFNGLIADTDRILSNRACHYPIYNRFDLLCARVVADYNQFADHIQFDYGVEYANRRAFIRAEEALQIRVRQDDRPC